MSEPIEPIDLGTECPNCKHSLGDHEFRPLDGSDLSQGGEFRCVMFECRCVEPMPVSVSSFKH